MPLLVVLGAGASFDAVSASRNEWHNRVRLREGISRVDLTAESARPPLANELVDGRPSFLQFIDDYPAVRPLIDRLRSAETTNALEDNLGAYEVESETNPVKLHHLAAMRFYIRDVIAMCTDAVLSHEFRAGITNHVRLVRDLHDWAVHNREHVCFVSFNYDVLLEQACQDVWMFDRRKLDNFVTDNIMSVIKPHGSVEWSRPFGPILSLAGSPDEMRRVRADAAIRAARESRPLPPVTYEGSPFTPPREAPVSMPALAPPIRDKADFEWPDSQRLFLEKLKGRVDRLLIIGWRAAEQHFLDLARDLFQGLALPTMIVTGGPAGADEAVGVATNLGLRLSDRVTLNTNGFSPWMATDELTRWLREGFNT